MEGTGQPAPEYKQNEFMVYATIRQHGDAVTTEKTTEKILSLSMLTLWRKEGSGTGDDA